MLSDGKGFQGSIKCTSTQGQRGTMHQKGAVHDPNNRKLVAQNQTSLYRKWKKAMNISASRLLESIHWLYPIRHRAHWLLPLTAPKLYQGFLREAKTVEDPDIPSRVCNFPVTPAQPVRKWRCDAALTSDIQSQKIPTLQRWRGFHQLRRFRATLPAVSGLWSKYRSHGFSRCPFFKQSSSKPAPSMSAYQCRCLEWAAKMLFSFVAPSRVKRGWGGSTSP